MSFSSLPFLFVFFPVSLALYLVVPRKLKPAALLILSLVFYAWGDVRHIVILLFSILFNYFAGLELRALREQDSAPLAKTAVVTTTAVNILVLCFYKYFSDTLPIGISFFTFSALSYIFDVYRGKAEGERNPITAALYIAFFPKLISGPILQYAAFREQLDSFRVTRGDFFAGLELFLVGLFKKILLADRLGAVFTAIHGMSAMASATAWLGMILYSLQLYYDFSGYSDMALGLSRMLGFRIGPNFDHPYTSKNVGEFWRRWHISLGAWFRDYVYIPLGGNRCGARRQLLNLAAVWLLTGIWHGSSLNFVFWGVYHGLFIVLERFVIQDRLDRVPHVLRALLTNLIVFIGWVFFFSPSLGAGFAYLGQMLGADRLGFWDSATSYYLRNNLVTLLAAVLFAGPALRNLHENIVTRFPRGGLYVSSAAYGVLLLFSIAAMVNATYSSFLYFQF